jgi:hypothetical protein
MPSVSGLNGVLGLWTQQRSDADYKTWLVSRLSEINTRCGANNAHPNQIGERIMKKLFLAGVAAAVLALTILALASAADEERPFRATFGGMFTNKGDFNYTGAEGELGMTGTVTGKSTLGAFTGYVVASGMPTNEVCTGIGGAQGVRPLNRMEAFLLSFEDTSEQLFLKLSPTNPGQGCNVPGVGNEGTFNFDIMGGTGRFEGATGSISKTYQLIPVLAVSPPGRGGFSSFTGTFEGSIKLAEGGLWPF